MAFVTGTTTGTVADSLGTVSITSITQTGGIATATVASTASLLSGQNLIISGATPSAYNGLVNIVVASGTTFTYSVPGGTTSPATGTITYIRPLLHTVELLGIIKTFLTTNATLAALTPPQTWTANRDTFTPTIAQKTLTLSSNSAAIADREVQLQWNGLAGTDNYYGSIVAYHDAGSGVYNLAFRANTGYNSSAGWDTQPGYSPTVYLSLWNSAITYYLWASGRRMMISCQIATTVWESAYMGLILPYATPSQAPYPMFLGGTSGFTSPGGQGTWTYADAHACHRAYWDPGLNGAFLYGTDGVWHQCANLSDNTPITPDDAGYVALFPYSGNSANRILAQNMHPNLDNSYTLTPIELVQSNYPTIPSNCQTWGALDGIYHITGSGVGVGSVITIGGSSYLVMQDVSRTGHQNYTAILEA